LGAVPSFYAKAQFILSLTKRRTSSFLN